MFRILRYLNGKYYLVCEEGAGVCALIMTVISMIMIVISLPLSLFFVVKVVQVRRHNSSHNNSGNISVMSSIPSSGVWEGGHLQAGQTPSWRSQGTRPLLRHALHWYLQESRSQDRQLWCSSTGGRALNNGLKQQYFELIWKRKTTWTELIFWPYF